jgi:hypothetical protein
MWSARTVFPVRHAATFTIDDSAVFAVVEQGQ